MLHHLKISCMMPISTPNGTESKLRQRKEIMDVNLLESNFSKMAKAFAHIHRIDILKLLLEKEELCCSSIVDKLPLAQSTVSQHLKILKNANLINGKVKGPSVLYSLNQDSLPLFKNLFDKIFNGPSKE